MNLQEEIGVRHVAEIEADKRAANYQKSLDAIPDDAELRDDDEIDFAMQDEFVDFMEWVLYAVLGFIVLGLLTR